MIDGFGVSGSALHYGLVISFAGSALFTFLYLWKKKRLDMDESPKYQMLQSEDENREGKKDE